MSILDKYYRSQENKFVLAFSLTSVIIKYLFDNAFENFSNSSTRRIESF